MFVPLTLAVAPLTPTLARSANPSELRLLFDPPATLLRLRFTLATDASDKAVDVCDSDAWVTERDASDVWERETCDDSLIVCEREGSGCSRCSSAKDRSWSSSWMIERPSCGLSCELGGVPFEVGTVVTLSRRLSSSPSSSSRTSCTNPAKSPPLPPNTGFGPEAEPVGTNRLTAQSRNSGLDTVCCREDEAAVAVGGKGGADVGSVRMDASSVRMLSGTIYWMRVSCDIYGMEIRE